MTQRWPRGSEWRKWDLHLHAPFTKLNDQFRIDDADVWDEYCRRLRDSDVRAFGITDYFSADAYFRALEKYRERYKDDDKVFFPNIELRTGDVVNSAQEEVNVHLIFNPFRHNCEDSIHRFLGSLKTNRTEGRAGRHTKATELSTVRHFEEATTTREFIREALEETYGRDADLLDHLLIVTAANNDGIRPLRGKKRKLLITDEIDKFSHAFFGSPSNVDYFLDQQRSEEQTEPFDAKPVLSGSDAHSFDDLDERLGKVAYQSGKRILEPTWIKGDLTFEGLKQIVFEPENRVYIGEEPETERRVRQHKTKYIESLQMTCVDGYRGQHGTWFKNERIPLGKELVAIIGNKGSGKSAVTDVLGLLGNSHNQTSKNPNNSSEQLFSFLNDEKFLKKRCAKNFVATLHWLEGEPTSKTLDAKVDRNLPEKVEYLPQKYLERICANIDDDEFRTTLNEVIFRYVGSQHRYGQTNLEGLIEYLTRQAEHDILNAKRSLRSANEAVVSLERKLTPDYRNEVEERVRQKKEELAAHESARPEEKPSPPDGDSETGQSDGILELTLEIEECSQLIADRKRELTDISQVAEDLRQTKHAIERQTQSLLDVEFQFEEILQSAGIAFEDIVKLQIDFGPLDAHLAEKAARSSEIEGLLATEEDIRERFRTVPESEESIAAAISASAVCKLQRLENERDQRVEQQAQPAREYHAYLTALAAWTARKDEITGEDPHPPADSLKGLENELNNISSRYTVALRDAKVEQKRIGKELFQKKKSLTLFYDGIKDSIDAEIAKCRDDLEGYAIAIEAGLRLDSNFYDTFLAFVNQSTKGSFHGREEGRAMLRRLCDAVDDWENESEVFDALEDIIHALHSDQREDWLHTKERARDIFKQMKNQTVPVVDLYDFLFGFDYLQPKYDLSVDQEDLSELSPGERGGLLLIFYLMLDKQDIPLIVDQPEDNLDNKSVYEILVKFLKRAKKRRQIILVTHNPNLAVVSDAEQIVHVSIDKNNGENDFDFFSGSIEDPNVNQAVVDILEGTLPAFDNRRLKYRSQT